MKQAFGLVCILLITVQLTAIGVAAQGKPLPAVSRPRVTWTLLMDGMWLAEHPLREADVPLLSGQPLSMEQVTGLREEDAPLLVLVRIDPAYFEFTLHMASGEKARSLPDLARRHGLTAAINAGMYLPDKITSTGHMRNATHTNNPRVVSRFGAFFLAGPKIRSLPLAVLMDREAHNWREALNRYNLVIQNFRLSDEKGTVLWPEGGGEHSIAALAQDRSGNMVFLFCERPITPAAFARRVLSLDLGIGAIMYLEGGSPAALLVNAGDTETVRVGRKGLGILEKRGDPEALIPNVLGVRPRKTAKDPGSAP